MRFGHSLSGGWSDRKVTNRSAGIGDTSSQFATTVADYSFGRWAVAREALEFAHAAQGSIDHTGRAFTAEVIDDAQDPKAPAIAQRVGDEIELQR